jgi:gamma-glutamylaminecyclotransferase
MHTRVFVFGTLKEGFPNFGTNTGTRVPGVYVTKERYPLYLVGERHSPWMVNTPGQGEHVVGQVFEVKPEVLDRMDILERVTEPDGYDRIQIKVRSQSAEPESELLVHAYLKHPRNLAGAEIMVGPFSEYTLEHAELYRKRAL